MQTSIKRRLEINAPVDRVWEVLTTPSLWWDDVILENRVGGVFEEKWDGNTTFGKILVFEPPKQLALSWKDTDWPDYTRVTFTLKPKDKITVVEFLHEGWEIFPSEQKKQLIRDHQGGWDMHLDDLKYASERKAT